MSLLFTVHNNTDCKSLVQLSLSCKRLSSGVDKVASHMLASQKEISRYGGDHCDEDLAVLEELNYLRSPLTFTHLLGNRIEYVDNDKSCIWSSNPDTSHTPGLLHSISAEYNNWQGWSGTFQTAISSDYVMTSGKHYAKFYIDTTSDNVFRFIYSQVGIMRPVSSDLKDVDWINFSPTSQSMVSFLEEKTDAWGKSNVHACMYYDYDGTCEWCDWGEQCEDINWEGMDGFGCFQNGKVGQVGLLLDLDEGTLTVYKDGKCLGIMMRGLTGEYCWATCILAQSNGCPHQQNIRIERAQIPSTDTDQSFRPCTNNDCDCSDRERSDDEDEVSMCSCCGEPRY